MRTLSRKSFAIGLLVALLVFTTGRAVPVSALAELAPEVAPVFDTQIYQLQDYIDHGGMSDPQLEIFYTLAGFYALGQMGSENYQLTNPYSTKDGVLNWLKDVGIETYNTLITLAPDTIQLPDGSIMSTDMTKRALSLYIANLMGCGIKAAQYDTFEDFEDDLEESDNFFMPWNSKAQYGLNTLYQTYGGIYEWQFDRQPFAYNAIWNTAYMSDSDRTRYNNDIQNAQQPTVRVNETGIYDLRVYSVENNSANNVSYMYRDYCNLFIDSSENKIYIVNNSGTKFPTTYARYTNYASYRDGPAGYLYIHNSHPFIVSELSAPYTKYFTDVSFNLADYENKYVNVARAYFNNEFSPSWQQYFFQDWIQHVYVGDTWANRHEIFNVTDLNLEESEQPYYVTVPDDTDYLLDIKGILQRILNNTDLYDVFINNIYTPDGVLVHDTDLIRISLRLLQDYELDNPPLPVNLNDIQDYTDNTYLERLKEHARNFGDTFAAYVAFWHNADHDLVYTIFGASIMVLIGAFIGKWGHS